jgi:hypothetical protein
MVTYKQHQQSNSPTSASDEGDKACLIVSFYSLFDEANNDLG